MKGSGAWRVRRDPESGGNTLIVEAAGGAVKQSRVFNERWQGIEIYRVEPMEGATV